MTDIYFSGEKARFFLKLLPAAENKAREEGDHRKGAKTDRGVHKRGWGVDDVKTQQEYTNKAKGKKDDHAVEENSENCMDLCGRHFTKR